MAAPGLTCALIRRLPSARGLTLLELLVVLSLLAMVSGGVVWRLHDPVGRQLQQEADRLSALLEAARSQSRSQGQAVRWHTTEEGFAFEGSQNGPQRWLSERTQARVLVGDALLLGPEPVIGAQGLALIDSPTGRTVWVLSDGVRPFGATWWAPAAAARP